MIFKELKTVNFKQVYDSSNINDFKHINKGYTIRFYGTDKIDSISFFGSIIDAYDLERLSSLISKQFKEKDK